MKVENIIQNNFIVKVEKRLIRPKLKKIERFSKKKRKSKSWMARNKTHSTS